MAAAQLSANLAAGLSALRSQPFGPWSPGLKG
jgi:hypothetical protein